MKNLKGYLTKKLGKERAKKVYNHFYNLGINSVYDILDINIFQRNHIKYIRFVFNDGSIWEFSC